MSVAVPDPATAQRHEALLRANETRSRRAQLKKDLAAGRVDVATVLTEGAWWVDTMRVFDLLLAVPKLGRVKVKKLMVAARVPPGWSVGGLTGRQRLDLVRGLHGLPPARRYPL